MAKTAREWFQCLRPDLRDRAIKATQIYGFCGTLESKYKLFSSALTWSFDWEKAGGIDFWGDIYDEADDIESGRKPDIK